MRAPVIASMLLVALAAAPPVRAQVVAVTPSRHIAVAHDGVLELFAPDGGRRLWAVDGVGHPGALATSEHRIALLDPIAGQIRLADLATGAGTVIETGDTPVDAVFASDDLFVVERDARRIERIRPDGSRMHLGTGSYPSQVRMRDDRLYVYSRGDGLLQEITLSPFAIRRSVTIAPFASDFETSRHFAYFVYPGEARMRAVRLETFEPAGDIRVGGVPVDLTIASGSTALTAGVLAIADPASKRVWMIEAAQSPTEAFGRGFLRGILGLGLFGGRESSFRIGVDRVVTSGQTRLAYDSSSGTLYSFSHKQSRQIATGIAPRAFAVSDGSVFFWNGALVTEKP